MDSIIVDKAKYSVEGHYMRTQINDKFDDLRVWLRLAASQIFSAIQPLPRQPEQQPNIQSANAARSPYGVL